MNIAILSINIYVVFTLLFFIIKHFKYDMDSVEDNDTSWMVYYFIIAFFIILIQNTYYGTLNEGEQKCVVQPLSIFIYTIMPLCLIMGPIIIFLVKMNWNRIFANTFGLLLAPNIELSTDQHTKSLFFYNDPNILLQEIDPKILFNQDELTKKLSTLLGETVNITPEQHKIIVRQYKTKQNVGYFIWLTLTGIVTSLVSSNSILLQECIIE